MARNDTCNQDSNIAVMR